MLGRFTVPSALTISAFLKVLARRCHQNKMLQWGYYQTLEENADA